MINPDKPRQRTEREDRLDRFLDITERLLGEDLVLDELGDEPELDDIDDPAENGGDPPPAAE